MIVGILALFGAITPMFIACMTVLSATATFPTIFCFIVYIGSLCFLGALLLDTSVSDTKALARKAHIGWVVGTMLAMLGALLLVVIGKFDNSVIPQSVSLFAGGVLVCFFGAGLVFDERRQKRAKAEHQTAG